jgi:hypothetical protein
MASPTEHLDDVTNVTQAPVFARNLYSYQLDAPAGVPADAHPFQLQVHHWLLWYFHRPTDPYPAPADSEIDANVRAAVAKTVTAAGFKDADFVWYHNPGVSVPDVFHVQVFWRILHP